MIFPKLDMKPADVLFCMDVVRMLAKRSRATRAKVGCVIWHVKKRTIIGLGYNGTPENEENIMEIDGKTLPTVIHAEVNALRKVSWWNCRNSVLFVTHTPCESCAKKIVTSGIRKVYYLDNYGTPAGLLVLKHHDIDVKRLFLS